MKQFPTNSMENGMKHKSLVISIFLALISIVYIGCGDDSIEIIRSESDATTVTTTAAERYFPLDEGYTTVYSVVTNSGAPELVTFEVGKEAQIGALSTIEWIGHDRVGSDTTFVYATNSGVYFYDNSSSASEKILALPLVIGQSWDRTDDIIVDIITGFDDIIVDTTGGYSNKTVPTVGAVTMNVVDIGRLVMSDGTLYSETVKIANMNGEKSNFYWFTPGVGLVRYVIGASDGIGLTGDIVGELVDLHK